MHRISQRGIIALQQLMENSSGQGVAALIKPFDMLLMHCFSNNQLIFLEFCINEFHGQHQEGRSHSQRFSQSQFPFFQEWSTKPISISVYIVSKNCFSICSSEFCSLQASEAQLLPSISEVSSSDSWIGDNVIVCTKDCNCLMSSM